MHRQIGEMLPSCIVAICYGHVLICFMAN